MYHRPHICSTHLCIVRALYLLMNTTNILTRPLVRFVPEPTLESISLPSKSPVVVEGAPNVILETVKRGEDDTVASNAANGKSTTTVVLRLYEAFGGHVQAKLRISSSLAVAKAYTTNLLEDDLEELNILRADDTEETDALLQLDFRGFEVKTVKLVIGSKNPSFG